MVLQDSGIAKNELNYPAISQVLPYQYRRKVWNPCGFCCNGCSLQLNCIFIAAFAVALALINGIMFEQVMPDTCSVKEHADICAEYVRNDPKAKNDIYVCRKCLIAFACLYSILAVMTAACMLFAIYCRMKALAYAAAILWILATISFIAMECSWIFYLSNWPELARKKLDHSFGQTRQGYPATSTCRMILQTAIQTYFTICCIQFGKQIKAGEDYELVIIYLDPLPPAAQPPVFTSMLQKFPNQAQ
jgi:hypothetical protein